MHFLARLVHGDAAVSEELAKDELTFQNELHQFLASFRVKQEVLQFLQRGEPMSMHLYKLQYALKDEISIIEQTERTEHEILQDLKFLSREHYITRFEELCKELRKAEGRDQYLRHVLAELHDILMSEARKVRRLLHGEQDLSLQQALIDLLTIERHLVEKIAIAEDFERLFRDVYIGTARKTAVEGIHGRFKEKMRQLMQNVHVSTDGKMESIDDHYISGLTARVFNKLETGIMEAVQDGMIAHHPQVDVEYVNSPLFERFVASELSLDKSVGKFVPSGRTLRAFVDVFREMYNQQQVAA